MATLLSKGLYNKITSISVYISGFKRNSHLASKENVLINFWLWQVVKFSTVLFWAAYHNCYHFRNETRCSRWRKTCTTFTRASFWRRPTTIQYVRSFQSEFAAKLSTCKRVWSDRFQADVYFIFNQKLVSFSYAYVCTSCGLTVILITPTSSSVV